MRPTIRIGRLGREVRIASALVIRRASGSFRLVKRCDLCRTRGLPAPSMEMRGCHPWFSLSEAG